MLIIRIGVAAIAGSLLIMKIKNLKPEYGQLLLLAMGLFLFYFAVEQLETLTNFIQSLTERISIEKTYVTLLLKMIGIAYVCEFASNLCKDAGCQTIAGQVEMIGKLSILAVSIPIITALADTITTLL